MKLRIKEVIKEKGKTAVWLAGEIGITQPNMSNIVSGKSNPSLETLENVANALNVPVAELFEQPANDAVNCPHCGGKVKITKG